MNVPFVMGRGFSDPIFQSQAIFRLILQALSTPGVLLRVDTSSFEGPQGLSSAAAATLLALADYETPVWLPDHLVKGPMRDWLVFHTGAPISERPEHALFAIIDAGSPDPALARFATGEDRYPDRSATLIVLCPSLENGTPLMVTGPGIESSVNFAPQGIRNGFWDEFAANHERFPLGVDLLLVSGDQIVGLPRTSKVTPLDGAA